MPKVMKALAGLIAGALKAFGNILVGLAVCMLIMAPLAAANLPPPIMVVVLANSLVALIMSAAVIAATWKWEPGSDNPRKWPTFAVHWNITTSTRIVSRVRPVFSVA